MSRFAGLSLIPATIVMTLLVGMTLPPKFLLHYLTEDGPIESATAALWLALAVAASVFALQRHPRLFTFALLAALAGARELDVHTIFTTQSITKISYWLDLGIPWQEKAVVAAIGLPIAAFVAFQLWRVWPHLRTLGGAGHPAIYTVLGIIGFAVFLLSIDGMPGHVAHLTGGPLSLRVRAIFASVEEIGELMLPVLGFVALGQFSAQPAAAGLSADPCNR